MGEKWFGKKQSPRSSWTLFFFRPFPPHVWDSVFFRPLKMISSLLSVPEIFQHQGSGNSFRGAKGSLYWSCPIQIPPKCWGWSNLVHTYLPRFSFTGTFLVLRVRTLYFTCTYVLGCLCSRCVTCNLSFAGTSLVFKV